MIPIDPRRAKPRDQAVLDALESVGTSPFAGTVWRSVRTGHNPVTCGRPGGRWDDGTFDVLYTSESRRGAMAERRFHLLQGQPVPPSRIRYELFELRVNLAAVVHFPNLDAFDCAGIPLPAYGDLSYVDRKREYPRSQDIAEACAFLGADGLRVPSARDTTESNLVVFCEQPTGADIVIARTHGLVDLS